MKNHLDKDTQLAIVNHGKLAHFMRLIKTHQLEDKLQYRIASPNTPPYIQDQIFDHLIDHQKKIGRSTRDWIYNYGNGEHREKLHKIGFRND